MDDSPAVTPCEEAWAHQIADTLARQRSRVQEFLAAQRARMHEAQAELKQHLCSQAVQASEVEDSTADQDMRRRYEIAMDDLRELKARNQELERKLAEAGRAGVTDTVSPAGLDWETEKRRLLAALESDFDPDDEGQQSQRLEVEDVIRTTEEIVEQRDREIQELKQLLDSQDAGGGALDAGAAAMGEILDADDMIRQERDKLRQLQRDWEDKLRQAELEISVERARLAREHSQIEEKLRMLEEQAAKAGDQAEGSDASGPKGPAEPKRGRWLSRLGLKDSHET